MSAKYNALMGGGAKQDPAFHFLCERTNGGDFLILRANTDDDGVFRIEVGPALAASSGLGRLAEAAAAFERALPLTTNQTEVRLLERRRDALRERIKHATN